MLRRVSFENQIRRILTGGLVKLIQSAGKVALFFKLQPCVVERDSIGFADRFFVPFCNQILEQLLGSTRIRLIAVMAVNSVKSKDYILFVGP